MTKTLAHDTCRCLGASGFAEDHVSAAICPERRTCARYVQRASNTGPRTSYVMWACAPGGFTSKIKEAK